MGKKQIQKSNMQKNFIKAGTILGLLAISVFIYLQFRTNKAVKGGTNVIQGYTAFDFTKDGELTFNSKGNKFLSKIDIEIADDEQTRETGLMYRDRMKMSQGMLFVFTTEDYQSFWMHNTQLPLDMIFVNKNLEIITIRKNTTPFSDQTYSSTKPALYVIEVNAGFCDKNNIKIGDKIAWRRT